MNNLILRLENRHNLKLQLENRHKKVQAGLLLWVMRRLSNLYAKLRKVEARLELRMEEIRRLQRRHANPEKYLGH